MSKVNWKAEIGGGGGAHPRKIKDRLLSILGIRAILLPVLHLRLRQLLSRDFRRSLLPLQRSLISFGNLQLKTEFRD